MARLRSARRPFVTLARHRQHEKWIQLRNRLRADAHGGPLGAYDSRHVEEDNPHPLALQWADIVVLGVDSRTLWNVALVTGRRALWDKVEDLAWAAARARLDDHDERAESARTFFAKNWFTKIPGQPLYSFTPPAEPVYASLCGQTLAQARKEEARRILREAPPVLHAGWTVHRNYAYGIGVHATVEAQRLDRPTLEAWVAAFRVHEAQAMRGQGYQAPEPIARFLPDATEDDTFANGEGVWLNSQRLR